MHGACHTGESTRPPYWAAGSSERPRGQRWEGGGRQQEPSPTGDGSQGKSLPRHVTRDQAGLLDGGLSGAQEGGRGSVDPEAGNTSKHRNLHFA